LINISYILKFNQNNLRYESINIFIYTFRQYDISDTRKPKLTGQVWLGGSITKEFGAKVVKDLELKDQPQARYIKGRVFDDKKKEFICKQIIQSTRLFIKSC
jgi:hypothetical protein